MPTPTRPRMATPTPAGPRPRTEARPRPHAHAHTRAYTGMRPPTPSSLRAHAHALEPSSLRAQLPTPTRPREHSGRRAPTPQRPGTCAPTAGARRAPTARGGRRLGEPQRPPAGRAMPGPAAPHSAHSGRRRAGRALHSHSGRGAPHSPPQRPTAAGGRRPATWATGPAAAAPPARQRAPPAGRGPRVMGLRELVDLVAGRAPRRGSRPDLGRAPRAYRPGSSSSAAGGSITSAELGTSSSGTRASVWPHALPSRATVAASHVLGLAMATLSHDGERPQATLAALMVRPARATISRIASVVFITPPLTCGYAISLPSRLVRYM